jgi:GTP-binding protein
MIIKETVFVKSSTGPHNCPPPDKPEYAFAGRSNVGKSTLINMLMQRKGLAKTSATPGKTQTINHYLIDQSWYLADLPGYGYARLSKTDREELRKMIFSYLTARPNLLNIFLLVDSRISPQPIDIEFINYLGEKELPFVILFTKMEKLSPAGLQAALSRYWEVLKPNWDEMPGHIVTSGISRAGRDEILEFIRKTNRLMKV